MTSIILLFSPGAGMLEIVHPYQLLEGMYLFLLVIACIIGFIVMYLVRRSRLSNRRKQLRAAWSDFISELAICDTEEECSEWINGVAVQQQLKGWLSDRFARANLIRELAAAVKNMSGQAAQNISWFYETTGLYNDSLTMLRHRHWHVKARAIQQLSYLSQVKYVTRIYRLTNDKHELVRNEARIAVVKLTGFEGLRFLDVISYPLTNWQQICLLQELAQHRKIVFPAMERLLQSDNESVVEFCLRLITAYQVFDMLPAVVNCLQSPHVAVREKAIDAMKEIGNAEVAPVLVTHFSKEEPRLQVKLLEIIQHTGAVAQLPFLQQTLQHPVNEVKAAAARAIRDLDGMDQLTQAVPADEYPWNQLIPQLQQEVRA